MLLPNPVPFRSSFRWNAKFESIVNTQQEFTWKGNLHKTDAPMVSDE